MIAETLFGAQVPVSIFPTVGLNRLGSDRWPILMTELEEISHSITGAEPPIPELPTRHDILMGHDDERGAVGAGSSITAVKRYQPRVGAARCRRA